MRHPEYQYLDLMEYILEHGHEKVDRTGVGTRSILGSMMRFDLSDGSIPILTTKRVYWKTAFKEMLWFLTGDTNIRRLLEQNVRIWSDWPLRSYRLATGDEISQEDFEQRIIDDTTFAEKWGDLGPVYGKQWRRWLGPDGVEHDQIANMIQMIKTQPNSRRNLFHAWNVAEISEMAIPCCHMVYQVTVTDNRLNLLMFQRSVDTFLGLAWNLGESAMLLRLLAQQTDLEPGELVWMGGDTHVYLNHIEQVREQIAREPRPFPKLNLLRKPDSIDGYRIEDFEVTGYDPHPPIKGDVAV